MHLRGTAQVMEAIYPDGTREILNKVNWQGNWHIAYLYENHAMPLLPRGDGPPHYCVVRQYGRQSNQPGSGPVGGLWPAQRG